MFVEQVSGAGVQWGAERGGHALASAFVVSEDVATGLKGTDKWHACVIEDSAAIGYVVDAEGCLTYVSPSVARYGFKPEDVLSRSVLELVAPEDRDTLAAQLETAVATGESFVAVFRPASIDGSTRWLEGEATPLKDESGAVLGFAGSLRDITGYREMEQELRDANTQLSGALAELRRRQKKTIQQERLNALGKMASGIAHDFNNALMPILGYTDALIVRPERLDDREETLHMLRNIRTAAQDAARAVAELREFYRPPEETPASEGDLNRQITTCVTLTKPKWQSEMAARGIRITMVTELEDVPKVNAENSLLREALINLLLNAVDAMPAGGPITMRTAHEGNRVVFQMIDAGTGMSEETHRRCLEPFFSTKGDGGSGLGLSMVHGFVRSHKGTMTVDSVEGQGTTVTIALPLAVAKPREVEPRETPAPLRKLHVLVIDDEQNSRNLISMFLELDGHSMETASGGEQALADFRKGTYDLVITDRAMPDMSGEQVAARIKEMQPEIPIILLTGFGAIMQDDAEMPSGIDLIVPKPVTYKEIGVALASVMARTAAGIPATPATP